MKGFEIPQDEIEATLQKLIDRAGYCFASIKWDGYRCRAFGNKAWSSSGKLIVNRSVQDAFAKEKLPDGLDGELIVNDNDFQLTQSFLTTADAEGPFTYRVFDIETNHEFIKRYLFYFELCKQLFISWLEPVRQQECYDANSVLDFEQWVLGSNHEGVMIRHPQGYYINTRSSPVDMYLMKLVRWHTGTARIEGYYEQQANTNHCIRGSVRSTAKSGLRPKNTLGGFHVVGPLNDNALCDFDISNMDGITHKRRKEIWSQREQFIGKTVTYKFKRKGSDVRPRTPILLDICPSETTT